MPITVALCGTSENALKQAEDVFIQFSHEAGIDLHVKTHTDFSCLLQDLTKYEIIAIDEDALYSTTPDIPSLIKSVRHKYSNDSNVTIYILKFPIGLKQIMRMIDSIPKQDTILNIPIDKGCKTERISSIIYFENKNRRVHIKTSFESYPTDMTMKEVQELTASHSFASPYVSFLVNLEWVEQVKGRDVILKNKEIIPLSQKRAAHFKQIFRAHLSKMQ